jgi:hypothetical protein
MIKGLRAFFMTLIREYKMARLRYSLICIPMVLIALAGCSNNQVAVTVGLGEVFTIGVGQSARITGEDMTMIFNGVIGDSRCPQNVICVWEGVASSNITIAHQSRDYTIVLNQPGLTEQAEDNFIDYKITYSLNPYPGEGEEISPKDYRITMTLTK